MGRTWQGEDLSPGPTSPGARISGSEVTGAGLQELPWSFRGLCDSEVRRPS